MSDTATDDQELALALQLSVQDSSSDPASQTDMRADPNDPSVKDLLASIQTQSESEQKKNMIMPQMWRRRNDTKLCYISPESLSFFFTVHLRCSRMVIICLEKAVEE